MSTKYSPQTVTTGLLLYIDTANIKSFKGEATTNLIPSPYNYSLYAYATGPIQTSNVLNENYISTTVQRYTISQAVNTARAAIIATTMTTASYYTLSLKWKYNGIVTNSPVFDFNAVKGYPEASGSNTFTSSSTTQTSLGNKWYYSTYTFVFATCPTSASIITFGITTNANASYISESFDIYQAQFETQSYAKWYVSGTRGTSVSTGGGMYDLSGNNNHGDLLYNTSYTSSNGGNIVLDGINNTISTPISITTLSALTNFSLEIWTKITEFPAPTTAPNAYGRTDKLGILFGAGYYAGAGFYWRGDASGSSCTLSGWIRTISGSLNTSLYNMSINTPYHFVMTNNKTAGTFNLYVNGALFSTISGPVADYDPALVSSAGNIGIAKAQIDGGGTGNYSTYKGQVSLAKIYTKALSSDEILQNFNDTRSRFGI